jgi:hypothetical protein
MGGKQCQATKRQNDPKQKPHNFTSPLSFKFNLHDGGDQFQPHFLDVIMELEGDKDQDSEGMNSQAPQNSDWTCLYEHDEVS